MLDALVLTSAALAQTDDDYDTLPGLGLPMEEHNFGTFLVDRLEYVWTDKSEAAVAWDCQG